MTCILHAEKETKSKYSQQENSMDLTNKKIVVTGGSGFLGSHVCNLLIGKGSVPIIVRSSIYDLTIENDVNNMYEEYKPDVVIHLAASVGGIGINKKKPGTFYYKNLMMGALLMEYGRRHNVEKFVAIGTICAYPKFTPVPFREDNLWHGYPEETNAPYGLAKKMMLVQSDAYRSEFGFNSIYLLPVNLYGPRDNFNPDSSHVIPALIKKCIEARNNNTDVVCWGTGSATREFLYVADAAEAIMLATENYEGPEPVNIGAGFEISIKDLASLISELCGFTGDIIWDSNHPDGQPRRCLDVTKAQEMFGFKAKTTFVDGLRETIKWYEEQLMIDDMYNVI